MPDDCRSLQQGGNRGLWDPSSLLPDLLYSTKNASHRRRELSRADGMTRPQIRIVPTNSIFIPGNLVWVRIGYAVCTMQCAVIERLAFACASRRVRTCMRCKSACCPPIRCAKPRANSVTLAVPSDKRASHLMMKKCTAQSHKQSRVGMCPCTRVL